MTTLPRRLLASLLSAFLLMALSINVTRAGDGSAGLDDQTIEDLATEYYNTRSEWAGTYSLVSVQDMRIERLGPSRRDVHLAYKYAAIPGNRAGRRGTGFDQRVFTFEKRGAGWVVSRMGEHMSGRF